MNCGEFDCLKMGKLVHQLDIKHRISSDNNVENVMVTMYGKFEDLESAYDVFDKMLSTDLAYWNTMLFPSRTCKNYDKAFDRFKTMNSIVEDLGLLLSCKFYDKWLATGIIFGCYALAT